MGEGKPEVDDVYAILRRWAVAKKIHTYTDLSVEYQARTGDWFEPHGSWDAPLGDLNQHLYDALEAPAISALVVLKAEREPGGNFWGCAPNVPSRPPTDIARLAEWARIVKDVHAYKWPAALP
jgi:hypothetical protein